MQSFVSFLVTAALIYLGLCAWVFVTQRSQMYFPTPAVEHPGAEVVWLESHGERLKLWAVRRPGVEALVYFGGNAEDVAGSIDEFSAAFPRHSLYLVNYRGYGGSSGHPTEQGLFEDALAVYEFAKERHSEVSVMGRSLGSGVAVYVASQRQVSRLVLVTAFDSMANVAKAHFRWLPVGVLLRDRYDSASRAADVQAPVLIVAAGEDEIIPRARSEALAAAFEPQQVQAVAVPGVGHNTLDLSPEYLGSVRAFLGYQASD
jgi:hypothetical protein